MVQVGGGGCNGHDISLDGDQTLGKMLIVKL